MHYFVVEELKDDELILRTAYRDSHWRPHIGVLTEAHGTLSLSSLQRYGRVSGSVSIPCIRSHTR